jgi:hypothetical protein
VYVRAKKKEKKKKVLFLLSFRHKLDKSQMPTERQDGNSIKRDNDWFEYHYTKDKKALVEMN